VRHAEFLGDGAHAAEHEVPPPRRVAPSLGARQCRVALGEAEARAVSPFDARVVHEVVLGEAEDRAGSPFEAGGSPDLDPAPLISDPLLLLITDPVPHS